MKKPHRRRCSGCRKPLPSVPLHPDRYCGRCRREYELERRERIRRQAVQASPQTLKLADDSVHFLDDATTDWGKGHER